MKKMIVRNLPLFRILIVVITMSVMPMDAFSLQTSSPMAIDNRLKTYTYSPNDVYIYTGHYRYQSSIIFESGETIITISMGDTLGWQMIPSGNRLFLKPISPEASTNMTILTNRREYLFELNAEEAEDIRDSALTFTVKFVYPESIENDLGNDTTFRNYATSSSDSEQSLLMNTIKENEINRNYAFSGSANVVPLEIFDDGEFTYMEFRNKNVGLPAIFKVNSDGNESIINYRITGNYVVIEEVGQQFTLRSGSDIACVFNESDPLTKDIVEEKGMLGFF